MVRILFKEMKDAYILIFMIILVPLLGEMKFYPLNETFRISLGAPAMFFLLLLRKRAFILPGFITALAVVAFRVFLDHYTGMQRDSWSSFTYHFPAFFFYFTYACLFQWMKLSRFQDRPLAIGLFGLLIELASNVIEMFVQFILFGYSIFAAQLFEMIAIALTHSFIVLSFFSMIKMYEAQSKEKQVREQNSHMMMLVSTLYEEAVHLKKSSGNVETVTKESYDLYSHLREIDPSLSQQALKIAAEIHEVKKDHQRILAGLSKLISNQSLKDYMSGEELLQLLVHINEKYARSLKKEITFTYTIKGKHPAYHIYTVLSLINNLMANAIEAIEEKGTIHLELLEQQEQAEFRVFNSGSSIPDKYRDTVFEPGFTTKFDEKGNLSSGIGLFYVKEAVHNLAGQCDFQNKESGITFFVKIPIRQLSRMR